MTTDHGHAEDPVPLWDRLSLMLVPYHDRMAIVAGDVAVSVGDNVTMDLMQPLQAYDAGGRARAAAGVVQALAQAKEAGVDADTAMKLVGWSAEG
ncbi:hypothetical protein [Rhodobacteraceae bacterium W635]|uniref:hypothetical protein n=1 Tax=Nioella halotolerans TaxID=2303578 RepID=UPI0011C0E321